jgi:hypothetical protein
MMRWQVKKIQGNQYQCCQRVVKIYADAAVMKTGKPEGNSSSMSPAERCFPRTMAVVAW